jgi:hypothetical protein
VASRARPLLALVTLLFAFGARAAAPDLGHEIPGSVGLSAGTQPETGISVANRFLFFRSHEVRDRNGRRILPGFTLGAVADGVGVAGTYEIRPLRTFVNATVALPIAQISGGSGDPRTSIDQFGLADAFVQPLQLGWRLPRLDLVTGYAFYVPTGRFEPGGSGGVSRGAWTHEVSLGHTVYFDGARTWYASALTSFEQEQRKIGVDITRGALLQLQGGAGKTLGRIVDAGVVGYALWQVSDDRGADLPPILRGARDRTYGLGGEVDVTVAEAHSRVILRYAHDVGARARPQGQILVFEIQWTPWSQRHDVQPAR